MRSSSLLHAICPVILASASPRRQSLLHELGLSFRVTPAHINEKPLPEEEPQQFVRRLAREKAGQVADCYPDAFVIGADTVVILDDMILGKPESPAQALEMLEMLQGRCHRVSTGLALVNRELGHETSVTETTEVLFARFSRQVLAAYVRTGEPMDKAGAYGIQGIGGFMVQRISGSCSNVIGLPVERLVHLLLESNAVVPTDS